LRDRSKSQDALVYLAMMKENWHRWCSLTCSVSGPSSLLGDIERQLDHHVSGTIRKAIRQRIS